MDEADQEREHFAGVQDTFALEVKGASQIR